MWKQLIIVFLIIVLAVSIDLFFGTTLENAGNNFDLQLPTTLLRIRPLILIAGYLAVLSSVFNLLLGHRTNALLSGLLIGIGLVLSYLVAFPSQSNTLGLDWLYRTLVMLSGSRLALTLHASSLLAAIGVFRMLPISLNPEP